MIRRLFSMSCVLLFAVTTTLTTHAAQLTVNIIDQNGAPLPCRAWVDIKGGPPDGQRLFNPNADPEGKAFNSGVVAYAKDKSFACDGQFTLQIPTGDAIIHIERGKEYIPVNLPVTIQSDTAAPITITLRRWINMPAENFYSADHHVHFGNDNLDTLKLLSRADDLHLLPAFSYWVTPHRLKVPNAWATDWPAFVTNLTEPIDKNHIVTRSNMEFERITGGDIRFISIGAPFIFNLQKPVYTQPFTPTHPSDIALMRQAKANSPNCVIDTDKPLWAQNVVGVGLGLFDAVELCHNHYHRLKNIPAGWGMVGPLDPADQNLGDNELFIRTNSIYYRWLNCGFKLAASGGSAMGVMPVPLGYSRTYAQLTGPLTAANYWDAVKRGRTFATSGPILTLTINNQSMGSTIAFNSNTSTPLQIQTRLRSIDPVHTLRLIHNGSVLREISLPPASPSTPIDKTLTSAFTPTRSGWYATQALYQLPTGEFRQAHTSPIYVTVDNKPTAFAKDARYMLRWIDALEKVANQPDRYETDAQRQATLDVYHEARAVYQSIVKRAKTHWND